MRYQSSRARRQFLAGVRCPICHVQDSIVHIQVFEPKLNEYIECIECGHKENRPSADSVGADNIKITNAGIKIVSL